MKKERENNKKETFFYNDEGILETTQQITNSYLSGILDEDLKDNYLEGKNH